MVKISEYIYASNSDMNDECNMKPFPITFIRFTSLIGHRVIDNGFTVVYTKFEHLAIPHCYKNMHGFNEIFTEVNVAYHLKLRNYGKGVLVVFLLG